MGKIIIIIKKKNIHSHFFFLFPFLKQMTIKAIIFDLGKSLYRNFSFITFFFVGGVCVGSPMAGIHAYEKKHGLPRNYINVAM